MLCATSAVRHAEGPDTGQYTAEALQLLLTLGRYVRLFNLLLYASLTSRFAVLRTPRGMRCMANAPAWERHSSPRPCRLRPTQLAPRGCSTLRRSGHAAQSPARG